MVITKGNATFKPKEEEVMPNTEAKETVHNEVKTPKGMLQEFESLFLLAEEEKNELDLCHITKSDVKEVKQLIHSYVPQPSKKSPVEMKILLSDECPVYERPKRLSFVDKGIVDSTVEKLLTGVEMRANSFPELQELLEEEAIEELEVERTNVRQEAQHNMERIQEENRKSYNKNRKKGGES
ncbi:uncharacterized protein LOC124461295 [Drosophila willistoni]|uniref:uncharacterized protein LOC124461288 n=1 Tax=Drosophila willistoni TaxID=7260 RepID=UPI001F07E513|nr:uncharacterized protein LOC124461288 [Drosophila willistoni]XP_046868786.1 uncharacterized protein LOC124461295 [Drosophila willistoni]